MRSKLFTLGATVALALGAPAAADEAATASASEASAPAAAPASSEPSAPATAEPGASAEAPASQDASEPAAASKTSRSRASDHAVTLGPEATDAEGRTGRIHVVVSGDTLWDISDAYLGTPWVWPSVWKDNSEIQNPHLIMPGDKLWVSEGQIRRLTDAEAAELLAGSGQVPAALADGMETARPHVRVAEIETVGFVTSAQLEGAATIVDSHIDRVWLGDHDEVIVGLGEGEVHVGDRLEIFRRGPSVRNPETDLPIGWETTILGWLEVKAVHAETATAVIRLSRAEIRRGDRVIAKPEVTSEIAVGSPPDVEGALIHTPADRYEIGQADVVYLNRGAAHGLEIGSPLEVFRDVGKEHDEVRKRDLALPHDVVAKLLVVATTPDTSTAVVTHATDELNPGDRFRGTQDLSW